MNYIIHDNTSFFTDKEYIAALTKERERWRAKCEEEKIRYKGALELYDGFISKTVEFLTYLGWSSSLELCDMSAYLIYNGYLSIGRKKENKPIGEEIRHRLGTAIVCGGGVCRNNAGAVEDIFKCAKLPGDIIWNCIYYSGLDYFSGGDHAINLIYYNDVPYGFDTYNGGILRFTSNFFLTSLNPKDKQRLLYKPYAEYIYGDRDYDKIIEKLKALKELSKNDPISFEEFLAIHKAVLDKMKEHKSDLGEFHESNEEIKSSIVEEINAAIKR